MCTRHIHSLLQRLLMALAVAIAAHRSTGDQSVVDPLDEGLFIFIKNDGNFPAEAHVKVHCHTTAWRQPLCGMIGSLTRNRPSHINSGSKRSIQPPYTWRCNLMPAHCARAQVMQQPEAGRGAISLAAAVRKLQGFKSRVAHRIDGSTGIDTEAPQFESRVGTAQPGQALPAVNRYRRHLTSLVCPTLHTDKLLFA